eukprot:6214462-Pleurochrysis_carterae.AAC.9
MELKSTFLAFTTHGCPPPLPPSYFSHITHLFSIMHAAALISAHTLRSPPTSAALHIGNDSVVSGKSHQQQASPTEVNFPDLHSAKKPAGPAASSQNIQSAKLSARAAQCDFRLWFEQPCVSDCSRAKQGPRVILDLNAFRSSKISRISCEGLKWICKSSEPVRATGMRAVSFMCQGQNLPFDWHGPGIMWDRLMCAHAIENVEHFKVQNWHYRYNIMQARINKRQGCNI